MSLAAGVLAVNAAFVAVGYALLGRARWHPSWAGVALLVGAGVVGTLVFFATIVGLRATTWVAAGAAAVVAAAGVAAGRRLPARREPSNRLLLGRSRRHALAGAAFGIVAVVCLLGVVGGFRSSPWLDDAWGIWLPKGLALWHHGLDERLFVPNGEFVVFGVPDYPLWWSVVTSLDVQAVGSTDVRVMCAQLALLTVAFVGAVARLLWGYVRPGVLAGALLLLVLSPELWRHVQGGVADLPLALYLATGVLCGALWLRTRSTFHLVLAGVCAAFALQIKSEALPEVAALAVVGALFARRLALAGLSLVFALPWLAWKWAHDVPGRAELDFSRVERLPDALLATAEHLFDPTEWTLLLIAAIALALLARRPAALLVPASLLAVILVAYWIDRDEIGYLVSTSAYRVIDPVVLSAAVLIPLLAEAFLQQREPLRQDRALVGEP
jgi:hypothetical protein